MVPAAAATETTVTALAELLDAGDIVVDGGNSNFRDSMRHGALLAESGAGGFWNLIGPALGVSRQSAREKYALVDDSN